MKKIFKLLLIATVLSACFSFAVSAEKVESFSDLPETHWAYSTVMPMVEKGLFNGTSTPIDGVGTFSPDKPMTRAEFLAVICRTYFADEIYTPASGLPWWDPYFTIGTKHELFSYQLNYVQLDVEITRAEAILLTTRALEATGTPLKAKNPYYLPDEYAISKYYDTSVISASSLPRDLINAVSLCFGSGIIGGVDEKGTFDPHGKLTRAAAATVLCRMTDESKRLSIDKYEGILEKIEVYDGCERGEQYLSSAESLDDPHLEPIKYATATEEGLYRIHCRYCDYYVDVPFRAHECYGSLDDYQRCGDKVWDGQICQVATFTDIPDSWGAERGYNYTVEISCNKRFTQYYDRQSVKNREDAIHQYNDWEIVSLPGKGIEGRLVKTCENCDEYFFKVLPMYSTDGAVLDVRDSYYTYNHSRAEVSADNGDPDEERVTADYSKDAKYNKELLSSFVSATTGLILTNEGLYYSHYNYGQGHTIRFNSDWQNNRFGINVLSFDRHYNDIVFEGIYFFSGDREVTYALCEVLRFLAENGSEATTTEKIAEFGFKVWDETENSVKLSMNGIEIFWEWDNGWPGNTFYFTI